MHLPFAVSALAPPLQVFAALQLDLVFPGERSHLAAFVVPVQSKAP